MVNGIFGTIQGPFDANQDIVGKMKQKNGHSFSYLSKVGIHLPGGVDFNLQNNHQVKINEQDVLQIGFTRVLELENVNITSLSFNQKTNDRVYIDYLGVEK